MHVFLSLVALLFPLMLAADDTPLEALQTGDAARQWEAVGRLDIGDTGFCTGALISETLVLTAAHCLFDKTTSARVNPNTIEFRAGWRNGRAEAYRRVKRAVIHPDYDFNGNVTATRVKNDVALLELAQPVRNGRIVPFEIAPWPRKGTRVGVVSYAKGRSEAPSLQEACRVMARQFGMLVLSCDVSFGSSGAPVFTFQRGRAQIASVISAMANVEGEPVSLGTSLAAQISDVRAELDGGKGVFPADASRIRRLGDGNSGLGAKFVRP